MRTWLRLTAAAIVAWLGNPELLKADNEMPGLNREVKLLSVEPDQSLDIEIEFPKGFDKNKPESPQGLALWFHKDEKLLAYWANVPLDNDPRQFDQHGGRVNPTVQGKGGSFHWKN